MFRASLSAVWESIGFLSDALLSDFIKLVKIRLNSVCSMLFVISCFRRSGSAKRVAGVVACIVISHVAETLFRVRGKTLVGLEDFYFIGKTLLQWWGWRYL
jgi:hypothetical protein